MIRLAPSERAQLERAHRAAIADERTTCRELSSWAREALRNVAHQIIRSVERVPPATSADPRQVKLEDVNAAKRTIPAGADVQGFEEHSAAPADDEVPAGPARLKSGAASRGELGRGARAGGGRERARARS